ncbi:MAG: hypothetical protein MUO53_04435 [Maribacter sp.]|nr:hypothetical protein [Maribacter sp.]
MKSKTANTQNRTNSASKKELKTYYTDLLGTADMLFFANFEVGSHCIAEFLVSQFLHNVDGKALGTLSSGPYGILRGLGIPEREPVINLKQLKEARLLLSIRADYLTRTFLVRSQQSPAGPRSYFLVQLEAGLQKSSKKKQEAKASCFP